MKKPLYVILWLTALATTPAFGQDQTPIPGGRPLASVQDKAPATLTKFDLDFPGGSPNELVAAIQKSMGHPLNAIVPIDYASLTLPPLKMKGVNVAQLFQALEQASQWNPEGFRTMSSTSFGFKAEGTISDDSIWYFYKTGRPKMPKESRFYLLTPYLDRGLTVDDITTAIQTGWKMLGNSPASLSFHKETKLLIVVGDGYQLQTIDQVLGALSAPTPAAKAKPEPEKAKP